MSIFCPKCYGRGKVAVLPIDEPFKLGEPLPLVDCRTCDGMGRVATFEEQLPRVLGMGTLVTGKARPLAVEQLENQT